MILNTVCINNLHTFSSFDKCTSGVIFLLNFVFFCCMAIVHQVRKQIYRQRNKQTHKALEQEARRYLGIHLDSNFSRQPHIEAILAKATQRLHFLKQLSHARVPHSQLQHFYLTVIQPVLEYASPIWQSDQSDSH